MNFNVAYDVGALKEFASNSCPRFWCWQIWLTSNYALFDLVTRDVEKKEKKGGMIWHSVGGAKDNSLLSCNGSSLTKVEGTEKFSEFKVECLVEIFSLAP